MLTERETGEFSVPYASKLQNLGIFPIHKVNKKTFAQKERKKSSI